MWDCEYVKLFWHDLNELLVKNCTNLNNFDFSEEFILFGVQHNMFTDKVMDFVILLAKYYIYSCKWKDLKPNVLVFSRLLKYRYKLERYYYIVTENIVEFDNIWEPYILLFA